jgi:hypothetical protein
MTLRQPPSRMPEYLDLLVAEGPRSQEEAEFCNGMKAECDTRLRGQGLTMFFIGPNFSNEGYRCGFQDREGRRYFCGFTYDEGIFLGQQYPDSYAQELVSMVCERALLAREVHFEKERSGSIGALADIGGTVPS